jgi:hypothetical protein
LVGKADDGSPIRVKVTPKGPRVLGGPGANNSTILDTSTAPEAIAKKLRRFGLDQAAIDEYLAQVAHLPENEALPLPTGKVIMKKPMPKLVQEIPLRFADLRLFALMGFEFLALALGDAIYDSGLDSIRQYVADGTPTNDVVIESLLADDKHDTFHILRIELGDGETVVEIRLFRLMVYRVHFRGVTYTDLDVVYLEDLANSLSLVAPSLAHAGRGQYFEVT